MKLNIYVPANPSQVTIAPRSAIVGVPREEGQVWVHYEGNLFGATNLRQFHERLISAAGRLVKRYPTVACACLPEKDLVAVGVYDAEHWCVDAIHDPERLQQWLGDETLPTTVDEERWVIGARSEGFWSNETGWVRDGASATTFNGREKQCFALPLASANDARWYKLES